MSRLTEKPTNLREQLISYMTAEVESWAIKQIAHSAERQPLPLITNNVEQTFLRSFGWFIDDHRERLIAEDRKPLYKEN